VSLSLWAGIYNVLFAFRVGAPVVLMERFDTAELARLVREHHIRSTVLPPAALTMLSDDPSIADLEPLRYVRSITAPLSPSEARRFHDRFGVAVLNSYGQTEIGGEIIGWNAADVRAFGAEKLGSVGRPHEGVEVRVVDDRGSPAPPGATGELWVRTPAMTAGSAGRGDGDELDNLGELGDFRDLGDRISAEGFFRTGDLGHVDVDGFVWIDGRVSDMINRGGLKVQPGEVEEALRQCPIVADVAVVGVPDPRLGEVPWAFVVPAAGEVVDEAKLDAWCRRSLAAFKAPVAFVGVDSLPRNEVGKVLARELRDRARAIGAGGARQR
jgi:acyl-CoA synthetase (AMP-forming)/AMP-acid ligase II